MKKHRPHYTTARGSVAGAILVLIASLAAAAPSSAADAAEVIVRASSSQAAAAAVREVGGTVSHELPIVTGVAASVPAHALGTLRRSGAVFSVTPNEAVQMLSDPLATTSSSSTKPSTINSVFAREINADTLWGQGIEGTGVRVALVDTGVTPQKDFGDRIIPVPDPAKTGGTSPCVNFSGEEGCYDSYGHGTFVAGLIAGDGTESAGRYRGAAPGADIVSIKIAGRDGSADVSKVLAAIQWVVSFRDQLNIRVLNLSLGTNSRVSYRYDPLNYAVERAWRSGIVVVVAASNRGPGAGTISKPGDDPLVITTGAVDDRETPAIDDDRLPNFSARGPTATDGLAKPDVVAPGGKVISLRSPGSTIDGFASSMPAPYRRGSGTSMSAGIVSGATALLLQADPTWTPDRVKFALMTTTRKVADRDRNGIGTGLIDALAAARLSKPGLANQNVTVLSDGSGSLDGSRGDVRVTSPCRPGESVTDPQCDQIHGEQTGRADATFDRARYFGEWDGSSWYQSQWAGTTPLLGSSWYGSSWYGSSWYGSSWYGSQDGTFYGASLEGSSWYGAWE